LAAKLTPQGVFWIGSGLAIVSAIITLIFIPNIKADEMHKEDLAVSTCSVKTPHEADSD
jgi:hypothetical protein